MGKQERFRIQNNKYMSLKKKTQGNQTLKKGFWVREYSKITFWAEYWRLQSQEEKEYQKKAICFGWNEGIKEGNFYKVN